jgi:hypothetical protein
MHTVLHGEEKEEWHDCICPVDIAEIASETVHQRLREALTGGSKKGQKIDIVDTTVLFGDDRRRQLFVIAGENATRHVQQRDPTGQFGRLKQE